MHFAVDFRNRSSLTIRDAFYFSKKGVYLDSLEDEQWFTTFDANIGYWKIEVSTESEHKIAFVSHNSPLQFRMMHFGLFIALATFQRGIDIVLNKCKWRNCLEYFEDIILFSSTIKKHCKDAGDIIRVP